jgi:hypothetical protein
MFLYLDTLYWFRAKNVLFLLLNAECLAEKQQYQSTALEATAAMSVQSPFTSRAYVDRDTMVNLTIE